MKPDPPSSRLSDTTARAWTSRGNLSSMPEHWLATVLPDLLAERRLVRRGSRTSLWSARTTVVSFRTQS
ncbi:unnamed protein product [Sphagnum balticum]